MTATRKSFRLQENARIDLIVDKLFNYIQHCTLFVTHFQQTRLAFFPRTNSNVILPKRKIIAYLKKFGSR